MKVNQVLKNISSLKRNNIIYLEIKWIWGYLIEVKIWRKQIIREVPYENDKKKQSFERFESSGNGKN